MGEKGILNEIQAKEFEWKIYDFSSLTEEKILSPLFSFAAETWRLELFPQRMIFKLGEISFLGYLDVLLYRKTSGRPFKLKFSFGLKTKEGKKAEESHYSFVFDKENRNWRDFSSTISRPELYEKKSYYLPSDVLTVFCTMWYPTGGVNAEIVAASEKPATTKKLSDALKQIMRSGDHSDTTIKVKGEDFRLHKSILGARSPYFDLMFKNEMKENITGIVTIDDCEPDTFRSYIHFLYTGKVDHISEENVCDLYAVADKYQDDQLKEECLQFMMNSISIESFCDYTILAITYKEQTLLNNAVEIFASKMKQIIRSVKWQTFLSEYPTQANELLIKALDHNPTS